jgi:hypothetical protein
MKTNSCLLLFISLSLVACATPHKPDLKPNSYFESVGEQVAERDITDCENLVLNRGIEYGETRVGRILQCGALSAIGGAIIGAVGGATSGTSGIAALVGASVMGVVGIIYGGASALEPSDKYKSEVNSCLAEKGYELEGWK